MAVASKSAVSARKRQVPSKARVVADLNPGVIPFSLKEKGLTSSPGRSIQTVPIQLRARSAPLWLLRLCYLQRRFGVVTFLLMAGMLTVYGWTAYSQQAWSQAYRKLETLQRNERQLTAASEVLKNQMARQAEQPATGLVPLNPATAIFLQSAPQRLDRAANPVLPATENAAQTKQPARLPLGY